jgi:hypothetical protein
MLAPLPANLIINFERINSYSFSNWKGKTTKVNPNTLRDTLEMLETYETNKSEIAGNNEAILF